MNQAKSILLVLLCLFGCQSASDLKGTWTGKVGPFKSALKFNADGVGLFCYSGKKTYKTEWAKYHAGIIHTESGADLVVGSISEMMIIVEVDKQGIEKYIFTKDEKLKNSDWFCRKNLSVK